MRRRLTFNAFVGGYVATDQADQLRIWAEADGQTVSQTIRTLIAKEAERRVQEQDRDSLSE